MFSYRERINPMLLPPTTFIAGSMIFRVVDCTKGDGEFIAHFESEPFGLRKADMMSV